MNKHFDPRTQPQRTDTGTALWQRENFLRWECGRLLRRELGLYLHDEPALLSFRLHAALDELRIIQTELNTMLKKQIDSN